jgi:hypothetical protein
MWAVVSLAPPIIFHALFSKKKRGFFCATRNEKKNGHEQGNKTVRIA